MRRLIEEVKKQLPEGAKFTDDNIRSELISNKMDAKATVENMSKPDFKPWTSTRQSRQNNSHKSQHSVMICFNPHVHAEEPAPKKTHVKAKPVEEKPVEKEAPVEEEKPVVKEEPEKPKEEPVKEEPKPEPEPVKEQPKEEPAEDDEGDFADVPYQQTAPQHPAV